MIHLYRNYSIHKCVAVLERDYREKKSWVFICPIKGKGNYWANKKLSKGLLKHVLYFYLISPLGVITE